MSDHNKCQVVSINMTRHLPDDPKPILLTHPNCGSSSRGWTGSPPRIGTSGKAPESVSSSPPALALWASLTEPPLQVNIDRLVNKLINRLKPTDKRPPHLFSYRRSLSLLPEVSSHGGFWPLPWLHVTGGEGHILKCMMMVVVMMMMMIMITMNMSKHTIHKNYLSVSQNANKWN